MGWPTCGANFNPRLGRLRALRAYGLVVAGHTYQAVAIRLGRFDGQGPMSRDRARQLAWRGWQFVRRRVSWVRPARNVVELWQVLRDRKAQR